MNNTQEKQTQNLESEEEKRQRETQRYQELTGTLPGQ